MSEPGDYLGITQAGPARSSVITCSGKLGN